MTRILRNKRVFISDLERSDLPPRHVRNMWRTKRSSALKSPAPGVGFVLGVVCSLVVALSIQGQASQNSRIWGRVLYVGADKPVSHASIYITPPGYAAMTGDSGYFPIEDIPPGVYDIEVSGIFVPETTLHDISITSSEDSVVLYVYDALHALDTAALNKSARDSALADCNSGFFMRRSIGLKALDFHNPLRGVNRKSGATVHSATCVLDAKIVAFNKVYNEEVERFLDSVSDVQYSKKLMSRIQADLKRSFETLLAENSPDTIQVGNALSLDKEGSVYLHLTPDSVFATTNSQMNPSLDFAPLRLENAAYFWDNKQNWVLLRLFDRDHSADASAYVVLDLSTGLSYPRSLKMR